jgi:hypothetical protein
MKAHATDCSDRQDIEFEVGMEPEHGGNWAFRCHVVEHSTNNEAYPGGLVGTVVVQP